jgi:lysozyme
MNEDRTLTPAGANLVKHFEGCKTRIAHDQYKPYYCPAGVLTVGHGHTNHHGRKFSANDIWSQKDCDDAFTEDMKGFEAAVRRLVKVKLMPWQFDALVSFCYNCGEGNLSKSTLLKKVNAGDFEGAALEFHRWNKGGGKVLNGLVRRRASEALLFQNIPDLDYDGEADAIEPMAEPMPQEVDAPKA